MMKLIKKRILIFFCSLMVVSSLAGCGFHLRGAFTIPSAIQILKIEPDQPGDPFQRILTQTLKQNGITVVDCGPARETVPAIYISKVIFVEKPVAYGSDVQINRATLQLNVSYKVIGPQGQVLICERSIDMERDLTIDPNSILGTESERNMVKNELYSDVAILLIRQLSLASDCIAACP